MLQNRRTAYKFAPFRTIYTQIRKSTPQNLSFAYKVEDVSVPAARFIRSLKIRRPSNPAFAYKLVPFITYYTQVSRDALQNRRIAYNSIPFTTYYTQIREDVLQNLDFAYKAEGASPSPQRILYAVYRLAAPQILHLRIN